MFNRWTNLTKKVWLSNVGRLRMPYKLTFAVTRRCNSRCKYCGIWKEKVENELTLDEISRFASNAEHLSWIDFTGGEPTLRPDFVQIVEAFLEHCPNLIFVHFPTNGLQTERVVQVCKEILRLRPPRFVVTVSIDGPPHVNDAIRGIEGSFRNASETYAQLSELSGLRVFAGMTLGPDNLNLVDETVQAMRDVVPTFSHEDLHVNIPHLSEHYYHNADTELHATAQIADAIDDFAGKRRSPRSPFEWVERLYQKRIRTYLNTKNCPQDCASLMASCFLAQDGTVYPCSIWDIALGNIRENNYSLQPLIQSEQAHSLRNQLLSKKCPNCWTPCEAYPTLAANILRNSRISAK